MTIQVTSNPVTSSGAISFSELRTKVKETDSGTVSLSELYRDGTYVPTSTVNNSVPTSGVISASNFYGVTVSIIANITGVEENLNASAANMFSTNYTTGIKKTINVNGYIISQNTNPALLIPTGAGATIKIQLTSGGIFGHRGVSSTATVGPVGNISSSNNGIGIPQYYTVVGQGTGTDENGNEYTFDIYGCVDHGPSQSGTATLSGGNGSGATVNWYFWGQTSDGNCNFPNQTLNRVAWSIANPGSSYVVGNTLSFVAGSRGTFSFNVTSVNAGGLGGGSNGGTGQPGNIGRNALTTLSNIEITGTGGTIAGGGASGGGGGGGGQEGGGGRNKRGYSCDFAGWQYCESCDSGVGGGSDSGTAGGNGGVGRGYSYSGGVLTLITQSSGAVPTSPGNGGGTGGAGGSGGGWGASSTAGANGTNGGTGPGGNCAGGGGGGGGGSGGAGAAGGTSIIGYNRVVSIQSTAVLAGSTQNN